MSSPSPHTAAHHLLETATRLGVDCIFTNLGSDHPAFIEAFALIQAQGGQLPRIIVCPHEMTALTAAHGHTLRSGRAQMVLVHVDVGTQNLGCSMHNAARGRIPAIIVAGLSPVTPAGDRPGHRTEFIHYTQDAPRQHEIGGQYMKWSYELRAGEMVESILMRGLQIANTPPYGPVYITGAREFWEEPGPATPVRPEHWPAARLGGLPSGALETLGNALAAARRPLVLTTYLGRQHSSVRRLVELAERQGLGVLEVAPQCVNFPGNHPQHLGYRRNTLIDEADCILMLDIDVPWIPSRIQPAADARLFHIDMDAIKAGMGFWHFPAELSVQADSGHVLAELLTLPAPEAGLLQQRRQWIDDVRARPAAVNPPPAPPNTALTVAQVTRAVRELMHERTVLLSEEPTGTEVMLGILRPEQPGGFYVNGGSGLGWSINAALGVKLADPDAEVICLVGDGSYIFGVPTSTYWVSRTYDAPFLTIIYNNGGWNAPKVSTLLVHPQGQARQNDTYWITMGQGAQLAKVAEAAGDAAAFQVSHENELRPTLQAAMAHVRAGRSAVVDVTITPVSAQHLN